MYHLVLFTLQHCNCGKPSSEITNVDIEKLGAQAYVSMSASYNANYIAILILISNTNFGFRFLEFLL